MDKSELERSRREARILADLFHPNICQLLRMLSLSLQFAN